MHQSAWHNDRRSASRFDNGVNDSAGDASLACSDFISEYHSVLFNSLSYPRQ